MAANPIGLVVGLIPAHAGKTGGRSEVLGSHEAHPRSRGENLNPVATVFTDTGSSPLTRGKPSATEPCSCSERLIPAHAGKT